jgi:osmoprotectant transport system ATP-binding protein
MSTVGRPVADRPTLRAGETEDRVDGPDERGAAMIRLEAVTKVFPGSTAPAVDGLSLAVPRGELVVLVGPSGCGKTTILRLINRLIEPTSGRITIDGRDVIGQPAYALRRDIGYVIQQVGLFPHRTVAGNIATVPRLLGWDAARIRDRITELLALMDLDPDLAGRYPAALSGGQRQRVGVARALAADPPVLLMDEPYGAVDPLVRSRLQDQLLALHRRLGTTIVMVTHDVDEAIRLGDRIAILDVGGRLEQYDTPAAVLRAPASAFVAAFLGQERGLRRLSLEPIDTAALDPGPVLPAGSDVDAARRTAHAHASDWIGVLDGERFRGWLRLDGLDPSRTLGEHDVHAVAGVLGPHASLRTALDAAVTSPVGVAVVEDDGRYLGLLSPEAIARALRP